MRNLVASKYETQDIDDFLEELVQLKDNPTTYYNSLYTWMMDKADAESEFPRPTFTFVFPDYYLGRDHFFNISFRSTTKCSLVIKRISSVGEDFDIDLIEISKAELTIPCASVPMELLLQVDPALNSFVQALHEGKLKCWDTHDIY